MNQAKRNIAASIAAFTFRTICLLCVTGTLMQTFMESLGFSERQNYIFFTILQLLNVLTVVSFSRFADKNIFRRAAVVTCISGVLMLGFTPFCFLNTNSMGAYFILLFFAASIVFCMALQDVCSYKLPYYIYYFEEYPAISAYTAIVCSLFSLGFSTLVNFLSGSMSFVKIMFLAFVLNFVLLVLSGLSHLLMKPLDNDMYIPEEEKVKVPMREILLHPKFLHLLIPNFLRGFGNGGTLVLAIVAFSLGWDETLTIKMVMVEYVGQFICALMLDYVCRHFNMKKTLMVSACTFLLIPLLFIHQNFVFLAVYFFIFLGKNIVDYVYPIILLKAVPSNIAGPYNSWRLMLLYAGNTLATVSASFIPPKVFLILIMASYVTAGICFRYSKQLDD